MKRRNHWLTAVKMSMIALFTCMLFAVTLPDQAMAAVVASGTCGKTAETDKDVKWTLDDEGLLVISGTGEMHDFGCGYPLGGYKKRSQVKHVRVEEGVTSIGREAFCGMTNLVDVDIQGNTLTRIGAYAFDENEALETITLPASYIVNDRIFFGCNKLKTIYYGGNEDQWEKMVTDPYFLYEAPNAVVVCCGPHIVTQPTDITGAMNTKYTFSLTAEGEGLTYQWYYQNEKGKYEHASTNPLRPTYTTTFLAKRNNRRLYCIVTDQFGNTVKSNIVKIHVDPLITTQPQSAYGISGSLMKFTIVAQGEGLTYRWFYKNKDSWRYTESTQTGSTYKTLAYYDGRQIYCLVTNAAGLTSKSDVVTMYVGKPTVITQNLTDVTAKEGKQATFTVGATGDGLKYTWYYKNAGRSYFTRSSETDSTYVTKATLARDGRQIYCVITDSHGMTYTTETVTLHVTPAAAAVTPAPETEAEVIPADTAVIEVTPAQEEIVEETEAAEESEAAGEVSTEE